MKTDRQALDNLAGKLIVWLETWSPALLWS